MRFLADAADILKLELLTRRAVRGDQRALRRGDRPPKMDLDAACWALEKWASARHADCGRRA